MAIVVKNTLPYVGQTKSVDKAARQHFSKELRAWVEGQHKGNQTAAGKDLGVTQGHVSAMLLGNRGPGLKVVLLLQKETGKSLDAILGVASDVPEVMALRDENEKLRRVVESLREQITVLDAKIHELHAEQIRMLLNHAEEMRNVRHFKSSHVRKKGAKDEDK